MTLVEISSQDARDLTNRIKAALTFTWDLVKEAYETRAWAALGYDSWDHYTSAEFGASRLRLPAEERREVVASLREAGLSLRAIESATGLGIGTVHRSLHSGVPNGTPEILPAVSPTDIATEPSIDDRYICDCGEIFDIEVWHCAECDHHWASPEQDGCKNCFTSPKIKGTDGKSYSASRAKNDAPPQAANREPYFEALRALGKMEHAIRGINAKASGSASAGDDRLVETADRCDRLIKWLTAFKEALG